MLGTRWTSRKFLLSVIAQIAALLVLLWPEHQSAIVESCRNGGALLVMLLSALGYVKAEAAIDCQGKAASGNSNDAPAAAASEDSIQPSALSGSQPVAVARGRTIVN